MCTDNVGTMIRSMEVVKFARRVADRVLARPLESTLALLPVWYRPS